MAEERSFHHDRKIFKEPLPPRKRTLSGQETDMKSKGDLHENRASTEEVVLSKCKSNSMKRQKIVAFSMDSTVEHGDPSMLVELVAARRKVKLVEVRKMLQESIKLGQMAQTLCSSLLQLSTFESKDSMGEDIEVIAEGSLVHDDEVYFKMREDRLGQSYHIERALAARQGIRRYPCGCEKCHGFKTQTVQVVETHHRKYGRDNNLTEPLIRNPNQRPQAEEDEIAVEEDFEDEEEYLDAKDYANFEEAPPNVEVNFEEMAENYFARVDEIHRQFTGEEDAELNFEEMSDDEDEEDYSNVMEDLLQQSVEPLFPGSKTSRLQFSIILMSLCTLYSVSHHGLDKILTFLKVDVLPPDNNCPKNSYEMKTLLMKLGLSHESIHCCECGKTLYWKENAEDSCPKCHKSRYIEGSNTVPVRVLRYFSLIKRLRRMFRCPEIAKHMKWHFTNRSEDGKMRSAVDSEQWKFIDDNFPRFSADARNVRMGLALDGVNPHSLQSSKHSVWPVMMVMYNLPPYLLTKRFFICLTMIIPGPKSSSEDTIDVYLQPLVHELKKLWVGVSAVDMSEPPGPNRHFSMRGMLMWTINDYPAYTLISGQVGKGYAGCPVCGEGTFAEHSKEAEKTLYLGHRRWLQPQHRWRAARAAFNGHPNHDHAPARQSGQTVVRLGALRESYLQCGGRKNGEHDPVKRTGVKRISILFQLPYWEKLPARHLLDAMHCEKNLCENIVRTLFGENDGVKSREDMRARNIRRHLHLQPNADGQTLFMPDAPYVLTREEREEFLKTLRELKFPSQYVGALKRRIQDGKLSGLKTHDFHILLEQVLPLCLRNIGNPKVIGAIMRVSRLFKRICSKVVDSQQKRQILDDAAETICYLEKEFPPSVFVMMMHLPIHLVEELFLCGPVHTRWMYPFERYMKGLKGYVKNKAKPEGSMAYGYLREESIGFLNEYLSNYTPTTKRAWDDKEEATMYDEVLEGTKRDRIMTAEFLRLIHGFVLDNIEPMEVYRSRYEVCVSERNLQREAYRRQHRRGGRRTRFAYPPALQVIPDFSVWVLEEVRREQQSGIIVDPEVVDTARGPLPLAASYRSMYAYGNHFRVLSAERALKTADSGVAATFRQVCRNGIRDLHQVNANVEYVGHVEEILELNYRRHCIVVLVCDFVKANYVGENATIKKDKWGFTLANYEKRPGIVCRDSFAFPKHCEQVFYSEARESPGWRVVLRKEVRGRRVLPSNEDEADQGMFEIGEDEDFEGLRPEREVGEEALPPVQTGQDVERQEFLVAGRQRARGGRGRGGNRSIGTHATTRSSRRRRRSGRGRTQGIRVDRNGGLGRPVASETGNRSAEEDDRHEEEELYEQNLGSGAGGRRRSREADDYIGARRNRRRTNPVDDEGNESEGREYEENNLLNSSSSSSYSSFGSSDNAHDE